MPTNEEKETTTLASANSNLPAAFDPTATYGFEDSHDEDLIIPRIKVIQALSPERIDGIATEGQLINSLTGEDVAGKRFIPIKQYYSNIKWDPDRAADVRILCRSVDGNIGECDDGVVSCKHCGCNKFDNTKTGKESQPTCTAYLNFLGFFEDSPMPVVLSFARTNYSEGRKLLSIAKSMRSAIWNYAYTLTSKKIQKDKNQWYILVPTMAGQTDDKTRALAFELFKSVDATHIKADYEDTSVTEAAPTTDAETEAEI